MNEVLKPDVWSQFETTPPRQRLVLLGASNMSRSFPTAVTSAQSMFEGPLSIYCAKGHGRSFGLESRCLGRKISGIFFCGLWRALEQAKKLPTTAFVTDIGNDLAYSVPVEKVIEWVSACLDRLDALGARVVISDLPLDALRGVGALRYRAFRTLLFPACRLEWEEMLCRAEQLSEQLHWLANSRKTPIFTVQKDWYGFDPIHPRRNHYRTMWRELFELSGAPGSFRQTPKQSLVLSTYLRGLRPESWSWWSISRNASQPNGQLHDGTEIALY